MKTKHILCNGCSFTDPFYHATVVGLDEIKPWPYWLSKSLGATHENLALSGSGNDRIAYTTIEKIRKDRKKIDAVCLGISGWDRCFAGTFDVERRIILGSIIFLLFVKELLLESITFKDINKKEYKEHNLATWANLARYFNKVTGTNYNLDEWPPSSLKEVGITESKKQNLLSQIDFEFKIIENKIGYTLLSVDKKIVRKEKSIRSLINNVFVDTFRNVSTVVDVCRSNDIPLVVANATGTGTHIRKEHVFGELGSFVVEKNKENLPWLSAFYNTLKSTEVLKTILDSVEFNYLEEIEDEKNNIKLVGWPWANELGGQCTDAIIRSKFSNKFNTLEEFYNYTKVSSHDHHWNETGHKLVSEYVYLPYLKEML